MNQALRWILLLPALFAASALSFALLTLLWNVVENLNIVPQRDVISLGLANFAINAFSAAAGVAAGSALVPAAKSTAATFSAAVSAFVAVALLAQAFTGNSPLGMPLGWHAWSTVGWLAGAVWAAINIRSISKVTVVPPT